MVGFTANDNANGNKSVIYLRLCSHGNGTRYFKRAGHSDNLNFMTLGLQCSLSACNEHVVQMVIKSCFNYKELCHYSPPVPGIGRSPTMERP